MARKAAQRRALARAVKKAESQHFREIPKSERAEIPRPAWCSRVFRNNRFHVLVEERYPAGKGDTARAMVVPHNGGRAVTWRDLQDVKNEIFGQEALGAQYFPPESLLVDSANVYWLFVGGHVHLPGIG